MIHSDKRKLCLSGWLRQNYRMEYDTPLKLQKFLLLYESFSKVSGETHDFSYLRGYKRGPVFSNVWGDYTKEREAFNREADKIYASKRIDINEERARKCAFIVRILTENELSTLTHSMNLWKSKENRIMGGEYQVNLEEQDFNEQDEQIIRLLDQMYPIELINNSEVIHIDNFSFVFKKDDIPMLTEEHFDILCALLENEQLTNPVYVDIEEGGRLVID